MNPLDAVSSLGHAESLGRLEDLPPEYLKAINDLSVAPLWPQLRGLLPRGKPARATQPFMWRYQDVRPHLLRAGELTPIEKAERRVLVLCNPGHGLDKLVATPTIYVGMQLILPGEVAPNHRHTPTAVRFVIEGSGGFTTVNGEKCPMEKGDLILTPALNWHEHGHEGSGPVVWLDALDLPMVYAMEASYAIEGPSQHARAEPDASQSKYRRAGLLPYASLGQAQRADYPQIRFPWQDVREALGALAGVTPRGEAVQLAYVNPETGRSCLPTLGFSAQLLRAGEDFAPRKRSASSVVHVIEGQGESQIDGVTLTWSEGDTLAIPTHAEVTHRAQGQDAYLFHVDDAPMQRALGFYEDF
ncbi:cupin domain-containing protein [Ottowia sp. GY511]|uniref:Cupin domain-containing protein n=1 Tax=Ottowia flava TaxID=2675430 RepID=A0ABW4KQD2_9BURK|nr:cupin domain-containing protein [Ottowia sp. GY511]TXK33031.1 cupin domain-containing protein [Ottowia sp. GY511]